MQPIPPSTLKLIEQIDTVAGAQGSSVKFNRLKDRLLRVIEDAFMQLIIKPDNCFQALAQDIKKRTNFIKTDYGVIFATWLHNTVSVLPCVEQLKRDGFLQSCQTPSYPPIMIFITLYGDAFPEFVAIEHDNGKYDTPSQHAALPLLNIPIPEIAISAKKLFYDPVCSYANNFLPKRNGPKAVQALNDPSSPIVVQPGRWETEVVVEFVFPVDQSKKFVRLPNRKEDINEFKEALKKFNDVTPKLELRKKNVRHIFNLEDYSKDDFTGIYACWGRCFERVVLFVSEHYPKHLEVYTQQFEFGVDVLKLVTEAMSNDEQKTFKKIAVLETFLCESDDLCPIFYKQVEQALKIDHPSNDLRTRRIQKRVKEDTGSSSIWAHQGKKYIVLSRKIFKPKCEGKFKQVHLAFRVDDLSTVILGERYVWLTLDSDEKPESAIFNEILNQNLTDSYLTQPIFVVNGISPNSPNKLGVMTEYCDTGIFCLESLEEHDLGLKERIELFLQILKAVRILHEKIGYFHGDIKDENILLIRAGDKIEVRLSDFGLSQRIGSQYKRQGTPNRLAPEILLGCKQEGIPFTSSVDVFALGHVILNVLLEQPSPIAQVSMDKFKKMVNNDLNFSGLSGDCLNRQLYRLAHKMLDRDPKKRPSLVEIEKSFQAIYKDDVEIQATQTMIDQLAKISTQATMQ